MSRRTAALEAQKALEAVAEKNQISLEEARHEIQSAIAAARENCDPGAQAFWNSVPSKSEIPTPEEVIAYIARIERRIL